MKLAGVPLTRENFLERYFGDRNYEPTFEEEQDFPAQFQKQ